MRRTSGNPGSGGPEGRSASAPATAEIVGVAGDLGPAPAWPADRPEARGKFLFLGNEKLYVRGVTYGSFRPDELGNEFSDPALVERDFAQMQSVGINALRTYTVPPLWLLDLALEYGLFVMVGLAWEQHVAFLSGDGRARSIEERVRAGVKSCTGHPAVLCYAIGNEIPSPIVRWHGRGSVERYLERLYSAAKEEDADGLVTYVNYPSTEYLQLPFVDLFAFNVYLEAQDSFERYLARLHNLAGERPVVMAEIGLDSRRNGEVTQAAVLEWQIRSTFASGCAGAFVFSWTDEWYRGGHDIEDWDFGLTNRSREPKPALASVRDAFNRVPVSLHGDAPCISVVVCTHNGARTLRECLEGVRGLSYPDYELIVVDDGSTDSTAAIAEEFEVQLISTPNRGLSNARNVGLRASRGEIVAYLDDDARPDPQWLTYLAQTFETTSLAGVGGPNLPPPGDGVIAESVARAPGGPNHVLVSDREAEHIPGCNMAFRKSALEAVGGFDPQFRVAGDDVDLCWRLQERGWRLGFNPAAVVWHHRRNSIRAYWKQQRGYGRAEGLLERKWPERYNSAGHVRWAGRLYGLGLVRNPTLRQDRVEYGRWGTAPFQSVYDSRPGSLRSTLGMPEWFLLIAGLAGLSALGISWSPLLLTLPFLAVVAGMLLVHAVTSAWACSTPSGSRFCLRTLGRHGLMTLLYLIQPVARLSGRLRSGLTPWRHRGPLCLAVPWPRSRTIWSESWRSTEEWIGAFELQLKEFGSSFSRGGAFDRWELEVRGGVLGGCRLRMAVEEHGGGRQLVRFRLWPRVSKVLVVPLVLLGGLFASAALDGAWIRAGVLGCLALAVLTEAARQPGTATGQASGALDRLPETPSDAIRGLENAAHDVPAPPGYGRLARTDYPSAGVKHA